MDGISGGAAVFGLVQQVTTSITTTSSSEDTVLHETDDNGKGLAYPRTRPTSEQVFSTVHTEFGHCANESYRCVSQHNPDKHVAEHGIEEPPYYIMITTYISYLMVIVFGHLGDFFGKRFAKQYFTHLIPYDVRALCDGSPSV
jgi:serine palmitoyltransferase